MQEEGLTINRESGDRFRIANSLEAIASITFTVGRTARAARVWGHAERLREEIGVPLPAVELPGYNRRIAAARVGFGDDATFDLAWREGREMTMEAAIHYALDTASE